MEYSNRGYSRRIGAAGFDRDHTVAAKRDSRGPWLVDSDRQDCWNRVVLVPLGSGMGYLNKE